VQPGPGQPRTTQQPGQPPGAPAQPQTTQQPTGQPPGAPPGPGQPRTTQQPPGQPPGAPQRDQRQETQRPPAPGTPAGPQNARPGQLQPGPAAADQRQQQQQFETMRQQRQERTENNGQRTVIEEPDHRVIIRENGRAFVRHDEVERFRLIGEDVRVERRPGEIITVMRRPGDVEIVTYVDDNGRLLRRVRRTRDGREFVLIDNRFRGPERAEIFISLPPPRIVIPQDEYIVEMEYAPRERIFAALEAPPIERIERPYTLDEIRFSPTLRDRMRRVDLNTITFEFGSWQVLPDQIPLLGNIAEGINQVVRRNPNEVFLIEGHTDAVGNDVDNLSLSDRRAESVAVILTQNFQVPPENLTTQGYGAQQLKVQTPGPSRENRRVTIRRITPLLTGSAQ
jgi:outer membrane protein OmpA-like peptidoglycan-associated protein